MLAAMLGCALLAGGQDEAGFEALFNGTDLAGWKAVLGGKSNEQTRTFSVVDGLLVCSGREAGYLVTDKKYRDGVLRFDYRYRRPDDLQDDARFRGNSGVLLFVGDDLKVWPYAIEAQLADRSVGDFFFIGPKKKEKNLHAVDKEARAKALRRVGEWSSVEIAARKGAIAVSLNGSRVAEVTSHEWTEPGRIGFQSEGYEIHWKNVRFKPE